MVPPLVGWPGVIRVSVVLFTALVLATIANRPWRWSGADIERVAAWEPSRRTIATAAVVSALVLFWIVLTRFQHGDINGIDFTIYFDRPLYQTSRGNLYLVETSNEEQFSHLSHLAVHGYWALLPLAGLYWIYPTPYWLLVLAVIPVVAGGIYIFRIARWLGAGGLLASATALAYLLNDNTARTLNYGFHAEVLYAWLVPWLLYSGLRGSAGPFIAAAVGCVLVKEDACFPLFAAAVALALVRGRQMTPGQRALFLLFPTALALINLSIYYRFIVPALAPSGQVMYSYFWANYGRTPIEALGKMLVQPGRVVGDALTSGFLKVVMPPHLFLPAVGWRWILGLLPIVLIYATSDAVQVRGFGIYYSIPLVPFLVIGASCGALAIARRVTAQRAAAEIIAAAVVLTGALLVGLGYSLRPWLPEIPEVPRAIAAMSDEPRILVQSGLYPHAGYEERVQLLTPGTLRDPSNAGAAVLIAPRIGAYPFSRADFDCIARLPDVRPLPGGLRAVRLVAGHGCGGA